jgi:two-component sensor histidine kinase
MGRIAIRAAEFRVGMNEFSSITMPVMGELSREGNLLSADRPLAELHLRAGGTVGGIVACPGLFSLGQIVSTLQMRLARAVIVSDGRDNLELWVEAEPKDDNVRLTILNWRTRAPANGIAVSDKTVATSDPQLYFDHALRLVGSRGPIGELVSTSDFGSEAQPLFVKMLGNGHADVLDDLKHFRAFNGKRFLLPDGRLLDISGFPVNSINAQTTGYVCQLHIREGELAHPSIAAGTSGALFGKNLAPALRQPLNRIIANAETIGSELLGPIRENYATYARDIANAARHLAALVDDLGDLEAVERADFSTAKDNIELGDVARRVAGLLALKAADHSIHFVVPDERTGVPATAEFRRVLQIMLNLGTNAIRYSPDGSVVTITAEVQPDFAILRVCDQGAGIKADDRDRIFEKFERLGRTGDGGSGLGLYISRRLARAMGGDLTVSAADGGGAAFTLRLPR